MARHPVIITARHNQGLAAYRAGLTLKELITVFGDIELMHEQPDLSPEQHEEIDDAGPSLIAGFADGLIEDIRSLRPQRGSVA
jgi:hypothetical protein